MSTAKRSRRRLADGRSVSPQPDAKRLKVAKAPHVSAAQNGLGYLVDEDARVGRKLKAQLTNGVPTSKSTRVDESRAIVAPGTVQVDDARIAGKTPVVIDISSGVEDSSSLDDDDEDDDDEDDADKGNEVAGVETERSNGPSHAGALTNGHAHEPDDEDDAGEEETKAGTKLITPQNARAANETEEDDELEEPTFGDLLKVRHPEPIDIGGSGPSQALVPQPNSRGLAPPSSTSLGTVLTQALKTNDSALLESCFRLSDLGSIRATIQRLPSPYVATLLQRIAERIHNRPGRTGSLMVWIQWSLVAHGAYLANQPDVMRKIQSLAEVIRVRANGLQPLLHLKGKLDLLSAQLELRRTLQDSAGPAEEEDEDEVLYIEGEDEDDDDSAESDDAEDEFLESKAAPQRVGRLAGPNGLLNGAIESSDEDDIDTEDDDMLDIEAEEASDSEDEGESGDKKSNDEATSGEGDEEEDEEDLDNSEDDDESEIEVRVPKANTLNRKR